MIGAIMISNIKNGSSWSSLLLLLLLW